MLLNNFYWLPYTLSEASGGLRPRCQALRPYKSSGITKADHVWLSPQQLDGSPRGSGTSYRTTTSVVIQVMDTALGNSRLENYGGPLKREPPCSRCRQKKIRCDKQRPCDQCKRGGYHCLYDEKADDPEESDKYAELQERIARLEAQLKAVTSGEPATTVPARGDGNVSERDNPWSSSETPLDCSCGRQIFNTSFSIHYDSGIHWIDLFPTVRHS